MDLEKYIASRRIKPEELTALGRLTVTEICAMTTHPRNAKLFPEDMPATQSYIIGTPAWLTDHWLPWIELNADTRKLARKLLRKTIEAKSLHDRSDP